MDVISFNEASTANGRIAKVIAEPDSAAGLVSVPDLVPTGETITIPSGRTVVHPNLKVDGTLNVNGTLFIPSGGSVSTTEVGATVVKQNGNVVANDSAVVHKTGDTMTGNLGFSSGTKIQGDFSNATPSSRTVFQTNVTNGYSVLDIVPNGTSTISGFGCYNSSDVNNSSYFTMYMGNGGTMAKLLSSKTGTGAYLPITFFTSDLERMRIDTSGNIGIGTSSPFTSGGKTLHIHNSLNDGTAASNASLYLESINRNANIFLKGASNSLQFVDVLGTTNGVLVFNHTDKTLTMISPCALGYGTGSGGTVTQATSKSTTVTLNKPTGRITMNNASLASGASVYFILSNNTISITDTVVVTTVGASYVTVGSYSVQAEAVSTGQCFITVKNNTAGALAEAVQIQFTVIKGAIA